MCTQAAFDLSEDKRSFVITDAFNGYSRLTRHDLRARDALQVAEGEDVRL